MNLIGKIFIVLIFIMSLLWMGFTVAVYATHRNWREVAQGLDQELTDASSRVTALREQKERLDASLQQEKTFKRQELAKLETEKETLEQSVNRAQTELADKTQQVKDAVGTMNATMERARAQGQELEGLRAEIQQTQVDLDKRMQQVLELHDKHHQEVIKFKALEGRYKILAADAAEMKRRMRSSNLPVPPQAWIDEPPPEGVDGLVLAVGTGGRQVEIKLGTDDGIRAGHRLEIMRGTNYVGRVEVVQTSPDMVVAKVVPGMQQAPIQRGDRVYTKLTSR